VLLDFGHTLGSITSMVEMRVFEDWFIYLKPGWRWCGYIGEHAHGFTTLREALSEVEKAEPCDCDECVATTTVVTKGAFGDEHRIDWGAEEWSKP
jgi:hypothetical protein